MVAMITGRGSGAPDIPKVCTARPHRAAWHARPPSGTKDAQKMPHAARFPHASDASTTSARIEPTGAQGSAAPGGPGSRVPTVPLPRP